MKTNKVIDKSGKMNIDDLNKLNDLREEIRLCGEVYNDKNWKSIDEWNRLCETLKRENSIERYEWVVKSLNRWNNICNSIK
jgi:hypothetical protein